MEKNIRKDVVVPASVSLVGKEGRAVDFAGVIISNRKDGCKGVVSMGRPAGEATEVITQGRCKAYTDDVANDLAIMSPLCCGGTNSLGGGATGDGCFIVATIGTHHVRAIALEAQQGNDTLSDIYLLGS
jgi:hypothetical protein